MAIQQNKYTNNLQVGNSGHFFAEESINQRDFDDTVMNMNAADMGGDSENLAKLGLGSKFGYLPGTETGNAKKRYSYQSIDQQ